MNQPRMLLIDIETSPIIAAVWTLYDANAVWVECDTFILSFAAKWIGERGVKTYALPDYSLYKRDKRNDKSLVTELWALLDSADIVIAHNGDRFDLKKIRSRFMVHGLPPTSPFKTVDTLKIARKVAAFDSNKLDNLGRYLGEGRKIPNTGAHLWRSCRDGDLRAWRTMRRYNAQDVRLLERVYHRIKPWCNSHPNIAAYGDGTGCPTCGSYDIQARGFRVARTRRHQQFHCQSCGSWFSSGVTYVEKTKAPPVPPRVASVSRKDRPRSDARGLGRSH